MSARVHAAAAGRAAALGLALSALGAAACGRPPEPAPAPPDRLLLISLDTVRRDRLVPYGYPRPTTPELDRFAASAAVFDDAIAQSTNTAPSHASMLTGLYLHQHGLDQNGRLLPPGPPTLAEILAAAGWRTGAFVAGAPMRVAVSGLDRGFEVWDDEFDGWRRDGRATLDAALAWWRGLGPDEPAFLLLHLYDAHGPYHPPEDSLGRFSSADRGPRLWPIPDYQQLRGADGRPLDRLGDYADRYDDLLRFLDDLVAEAIAAADPARTVVVVVADHGETLGERPFPLDHGARVVEEQIRIPLLIAAPGLAPGRVGGTVETVDLAPTLLGLLGIQAPPGFDPAGFDLGPLLRRSDRTAAGERPAFSTARTEPRSLETGGMMLRRRELIHAVRGDRWKLVRLPGLEGPIERLYDLEADPLERTDRAAAEPAVRAGLARRLDRWLALARRQPPPPERELDAELRRQLEALGYL
jgi:arylsulfatase A-like enzyme